MAKRFTDTDKWKKAWFYHLDPGAKLVWIYLLDQCDHSGIWPINYKLLSDQTGLKVDESQFNAWFHDKVIKVESDKYCIPSFYEFQYRNSKEGFKAKHSAMQNLIRLGLMSSDGIFLNTSEHLPNTSEHLPKCPSISIGTSTSTSTSKSTFRANPTKSFDDRFDEKLKPYFEKFKAMHFRSRKVEANVSKVAERFLTIQELEEWMVAISESKGFKEKTTEEARKNYLAGALLNEIGANP